MVLVISILVSDQGLMSEGLILNWFFSISLVTFVVTRVRYLISILAANTTVVALEASACYH